MAHRFADSCVHLGLDETEPYWRDVGTIDAFWQANIDLTDFVPKLDLYDNAWPIWTYAEIVPPAKFIHDEDGRRGIGGVVAGRRATASCRARRCAIRCCSPACRTHSYSSARTCGGAAAGDRSTARRELTNCVIDRGVVIPEGSGRRRGPGGGCQVVPPDRRRDRADHPGHARRPGEGAVLNRRVRQPGLSHPGPL